MAEDLKLTPEGVQPPDIKTADGVRAFMSGSTSEDDWNSRCDQVKAANAGQYPSFWFPTVMVTGLAKETSAKWGGSDQIKISTIKAAPAPKGK